MDWKYQLKCLDCKSSYEAYPQSISVGPVDDGDMIPGEIKDGIQTYKKIKIYKGKTEKIYCPVCLLRMFVAIDLDESSFQEWLNNNNTKIELESIFEKTEKGVKVKPYPVECPRCGFSIKKENMNKSCKECGSRNVNVIKSESNNAN